MKNILIIQDISSFGKCSTTVALPIISACGSTGSILPTAILSTHTGPSFSNYTFLDLFDNMKATLYHWENIGIKFDAIYSGYLGKISHIDLLLDYIPKIIKEDGVVFIDPVFADEGEYYPGFDEEYAKAQHRLMKIADFVIPNYSETCLMLGYDYQKLSYSAEELEMLLKGLQALGAKNAIITGVFEGELIGATIRTEDGEIRESFGKYINRDSHGTGDVFASVFVGEYMRNSDINEAIDMAVKFVPEAIKETINDDNPIDYGVHFEKVLHLLIEK